MNHMKKAAVAGVVLAALLLAGCAGGAGTGADSDKPATDDIALLPKDDEIAALLPAAIADKGTLVFATDATAPPNQFIDTDGKTIIGNEVDFANQIASILGVKAEFVNVSFDSIIPGLQAGRYDLSISGFRDTKEREELVDFVTYAKAGPQLFVLAENADKFETLEDLCGHSYAAQSGTVGETAVQEQSEKCVAEGKDPVDIKVFKSQSDQVQAVSSGQVDAGAQNSPNNVYLEDQTDGALVGVGEPFVEGPWGMPIPKDTGLTEAIHAATQKLIESDQYMAILKKWNDEDQAIDESVINGAIS